MFCVAVDESLFGRSLRRRTWLPFRIAMRRLDEYPWPQFYPLAVDPVFAATVATLLQDRLPPGSAAWRNWTQYLKGPPCG